MVFVLLGQALSHYKQNDYVCGVQTFILFYLELLITHVEGQQITVL